MSEQPLPEVLPDPYATPPAPAPEVNLYVVVGFAHKGPESDIFVVGTMAASKEDACRPIDAHNLRTHPLDEGWAGHLTTANVVSDELVLQAARVILQKPAYARGTLVPGITEELLAVPGAVPPSAPLPGPGTFDAPAFAAPANNWVFGPASEKGGTL